MQEWLSSADEAYADPRTYYWAIEEAHSGEVVGELFVDNFGTSSRRCEMDWKIGTAFQGKGYAAEAARAAIAEKGMVIIEKDELSFDTDAIRDSVAEKFKDDWGDIFQEIMEYLGKA